MKISTKNREEGSVLLIAFLTMTILTLICAVSLNVASQNANSTTQTTSWQQALAGAEAAADQAMNALNTTTWGPTPQWYTVTGTLPTTQPTGGTAANGPPGAGQYNYCIPTPMTLAGEASNTMSMWVTVDTAGLPVNSSGLQGYRIRAVGSVGAPGPARVSNQKLDNDLRKIALITDRMSGQSVGTQPMATRRIELIAVPVTRSIWARGISLKSYVNMSGGGSVDSFDSSNSFKSTNGLYDVTKRQNHGEIATVNSTGSDLRSTYVYGDVQYSGPAIKNTTNVQGKISTPFAATIPATVDPTTSTWWDNSHDGVQQQSYFNGGNYTSYSGGGSPPVSSITVNGSSSSPDLIKINGDFTVPGGQTFALTRPGGSSGTQKYVTIWVTGKFTTSGSGVINQDANVHVVWIVDGDITTSGGSYNNQSGLAGSVAFVGVGTSHKITVSGSANFIGTMNAPGFDATISGTGSYSGAIIANSLTISGGAGFHYDEALLLAYGGSSSSSNFAYASWFEDNSAPTRGQTY